MPALVDNLPLDVYQGEDWTAQIIVTDQNGNGVNLVTPMQMDVVDSIGQLMISLITSDDTVPQISYSSDIGLIQLHMTRTETADLPNGDYSYDLFATMDDDAYADDQRFVVCRGIMTVIRRYTEMSD